MGDKAKYIVPAVGGLAALTGIGALAMPAIAGLGAATGAVGGATQAANAVGMAGTGAQMANSAAGAMNAIGSASRFVPILKSLSGGAGLLKEGVSPFLQPGQANPYPTQTYPGGIADLRSLYPGQGSFV